MTTLKPGHSLMWYDNSDYLWPEKVRRGAIAFQEKFGCKPTVCRVHVGCKEAIGKKIEGIRLEVAKNVLKNHFVFGREEIQN